MSQPKQDSAAYQHITLLFNGNKHRVSNIMNGMRSCPVINIPVTDLTTTDISDEENPKRIVKTGDAFRFEPTSKEVDEMFKVVVYKLNGDMIVLFGKDKVAKAIEAGQSMISAILLSTMAMKHAREQVTMTVQPAATPIPAAPQNRFPPSRSFSDSYNRAQQRQARPNPNTGSNQPSGYENRKPAQYGGKNRNTA